MQIISWKVREEAEKQPLVFVKWRFKNKYEAGPWSACSHQPWSSAGNNEEKQASFAFFFFFLIANMKHKQEKNYHKSTQKILPLKTQRVCTVIN